MTVDDMSNTAMSLE